MVAGRELGLERAHARVVVAARGEVALDRRGADGVVARRWVEREPQQLALGLGVTAYAQVILERHDKTRPAEFEKQIAALPEVLECFAVTGEADYPVRVVPLLRLFGMTPAAAVEQAVALRASQTDRLRLGRIKVVADEAGANEGSQAR